jgi:hypothetical protein
VKMFADQFEKKALQWMRFGNQGSALPGACCGRYRNWLTDASDFWHALE